MFRLLAYLFDVAVAVFVGSLLNRALRVLSGRSATGGAPRYAPPRQGPPPRGGETARDPVCGMFVSTELSRRLTRGSETLHFCSKECLERYQNEASMDKPEVSGASR